MKNTATKIGLVTATIVGMNAMIGSGIFTFPASLAANVGPAGIVAFLFVIVAVWFMADSLARLASLYPEEGSFYAYAKQWGGHTFGMVVGAAYFCGLLIAMGLLAKMAGIYLSDYFPSISPTIFGVISLGLLTLLNMAGVALSELGQHILICCTVFPLIATTLLCLSKADLSRLTPFAPYGTSNILKATKLVVFGFFGFESAASLFNVIDNPQKNVPRALTLSITIVGILYILFVVSIILSTPISLFSAADVPLTTTLRTIFPQQPWIIGIIHFSILSAILGTIHSMIWGSSALLVSLAQKVQSSTVRALVDTHKITHPMAVALIGCAILATNLFIKRADIFYSLTALFIVFAYMASMVTLLTLKKEWDSRNNVKTCIGLATALVIFIFAAEGLFNALV